MSWLAENGKDKRKCPKHNQWKRKGQCEQCLMEQDARQKHLELVGGSNKPKVRIKTF